MSLKSGKYSNVLFLLSITMRKWNPSTQTSHPFLFIYLESLSPDCSIEGEQTASWVLMLLTCHFKCWYLIIHFISRARATDYVL